MLIDTHCHLDFERFDGDRDKVIERALKASVSGIIVPTISLDNFQAVIDLSEKYPAVYAAVGIHPNSSASWNDQWLKTIEDFARHDKVVAIGEIGLDYYWDASPHDVQRRAFFSQLTLAAELNLPAIIHNREASSDLIRLLSTSPLNGRENPGVLHSFSASKDTAKDALEMGFYLGFTGPVTFKKATELRDIAGNVPVERILVETDAPFLAPQQHRGKRNEPAYVTYIAQQLAELHNLDFTNFAILSSQNAIKLFGGQLATLK